MAGAGGRMETLRMPLLFRAHTILPPSDPASKRERGKKVGELLPHFERSMIELYLSLSSLPHASLDGQELTESLRKSPGRMSNSTQPR